MRNDAPRRLATALRRQPATSLRAGVRARRLVASAPRNVPKRAKTWRVLAAAIAGAAASCTWAQPGGAVQGGAWDARVMALVGELWLPVLLLLAAAALVGWSFRLRQKAISARRP